MIWETDGAGQVLNQSISACSMSSENHVPVPISCLFTHSVPITSRISTIFHSLSFLTPQGAFLRCSCFSVKFLSVCVLWPFGGAQDIALSTGGRAPSKNSCREGLRRPWIIKYVQNMPFSRQRDSLGPSSRTVEAGPNSNWTTEKWAKQKARWPW